MERISFSDVEVGALGNKKMKERVAKFLQEASALDGSTVEFKGLSEAQRMAQLRYKSYVAQRKHIALMMRPHCTPSRRAEKKDASVYVSIPQI